MIRIPRPAPAFLHRLRRDRSGLALLEFAFSLPIVLGLGLYGVETANLALMNMRISQAALNLADNASRVGLDSALATQQLREVDINDVLTAARLQGAAWGLTTRGRITLSSLESNIVGIQTIHWQRCLGLRSGATGATGTAALYDSNYGTTDINDGTSNSILDAGTLALGGMGDPGAKVIAPPNSGVMFVEINYDYKPIVSSLWIAGGKAPLHYIASFIVRDRRDFSQIYNPTPAAPRKTCNLYTAT